MNKKWFVKDELIIDKTKKKALFSVSLMMSSLAVAIDTMSWIDLITEMLWIIERETKHTLKGIHQEFQKSGNLTFDAEFRNHFLQIILKR